MSLYSVGGHGYHKPQYHGLGGVQHRYLGGVYGLGASEQELDQVKTDLTLGVAEAIPKVNDVKANFSRRSLDHIIKIYGEVTVLAKLATPFINRPFDKSYWGYSSWEGLAEDIRGGDQEWASSDDINLALSNIDGTGLQDEIKRLMDRKRAELSVPASGEVPKEDLGVLVVQAEQQSMADPAPIPPKNQKDFEAFEREQAAKAKQEEEIAKAQPGLKPEEIQLAQAANWIAFVMFADPTGKLFSYPKPAPKPIINPAQVTKRNQELAKLLPKRKPSLGETALDIAAKGAQATLDAQNEAKKKLDESINFYSKYKTFIWVGAAALGVGALGWVFRPYVMALGRRK